MSSGGYEFRQNRLVDRLPIVLAKLVVSSIVAIAAVRAIWSEVVVDRMYFVSLVLLFSAVYANLCRVKHELRELMEPPLEYCGYPILTISIFVTFWEVYLRYF